MEVIRLRALALVAVTAAVSFLAASCGGGGGNQNGSCGEATVELIARDLSFDKEEITLTAVAETTVCLDNQDQGLPHNLSIYEDDTAEKPIFQGDIIEAPDTIDYTFTAPDAGTYFFRCDVHPTQMTGTVIVE
ncbi:MAG TPA: cupredoxin domain-containing protein [Actinomycetota bacterium]|nr:cupredoxin domain-containing protein [Actinomycetota bacterium]